MPPMLTCTMIEIRSQDIFWSAFNIASYEHKGTWKHLPLVINKFWVFTPQTKDLVFFVNPGYLDQNNAQLQPRKQPCNTTEEPFAWCRYHSREKEVLPNGRFPFWILIRTFWPPDSFTQPSGWQRKSTFLKTSPQIHQVGPDLSLFLYPASRSRRSSRDHPTPLAGTGQVGPRQGIERQPVELLGNKAMEVIFRIATYRNILRTSR